MYLGITHRHIPPSCASTAQQNYEGTSHLAQPAARGCGEYWTAALALASAILQCLQFSGAVLKTAYNINNASDATQAEVRNLTEGLMRLKQLSAQLAQLEALDPQTVTAVGAEAARLSTLCQDLTGRLLSTLRGLDVSTSPGALRSIHLALKVERKKTALAAYEKELNLLRGEVFVFVRLSILDTSGLSIGGPGTRNQGITLEQALDTLRAQDQKLQVVLTTRIDTLASRIDSMLQQHQEAVSAAQSANNCLQPVLEDRMQDSADKLIQTLVDYLPDLVRSAKEVHLAQRLLSSLKFDKMNARRSAVSDTYGNTYEWIFQPVQNNAEVKGMRIGFIEWLSSSNGIYWLAGKAGSGKSTLVKFLWQHSQTQLALKDWAKDGKLIVASHFFWNAGYLPQRTHAGLLRALCFDIFRQHPDLMALACKERWTAIEGPSDDPESWDVAELAALLKRITEIGRAAEPPIFFCFFVDGFDECGEEDQHEVVEFCQQLSQPDNVKICASSRPWNYFENTLGRTPELMLRLQDLTQGDITEYVQGKLGNNDLLAHMADGESECAGIVQAVVEKADGVFLWVFLVIRELLKSLQNGDTLFDLQRRLERIPPTLEQYFQRMFDTIEDFYEQQTAETFLVCLSAVAPLDLLGFAALESHDPLANKINGDEQITMAQADDLKLRLRRRINARCRDLVDVQLDQYFPVVDFLHRTVRDFLRTRAMGEMLTQRAGEAFDPLLVLCKMKLLAIKRMRFARGGLISIRALRHEIQMLLYYASEMELTRQKSPMEELDGLLRFFNQHELAYVCDLMNLKDSTTYGIPDVETLFVKLCEEEPLEIYLAARATAGTNLHATELALRSVHPDVDTSDDDASDDDTWDDDTSAGAELGRPVR
ncbi:hypothetical protein LTS10_008020 [Elasticomyces elasticus]|nr:hypothetical protein LTS10_008020 [Elasticomyces elasticus]